MRPLRLARIAAEAEGLRLRHVARRTAIRLLLAVLALGFLVGTLVFCHVAIWFWARQSWNGPTSALFLGGGDLVLALVLALLASRSSPGRVELEAVAVRRRALDSITSSLTTSLVATQLLRVAMSWFRRGRS